MQPSPQPFIIQPLRSSTHESQPSNQLPNLSVIINCYQQKKVSLLSQQTLITDKSYYVTFSVEQLANHKIYVMYITSYRIYLMCTVDSEIVTVPHAYVREFTCFDNEIRFSLKTGLKYFLIPEETTMTQQIYQHLLTAQSLIPFCLNVKFFQEQSQTYDCLAEMQRMLINWKKIIAIDNKNGKEIPSYPKIIFVPSKIDKQLVKQSQRSRFGSRIPALTYYSHGYDTSLWRCGHTLSSQNNKYDFAYLENISRDLLIVELQQVEARHESVYSFNHFSNQIKYSVEKFEGLHAVRSMYEKVLQAYVRGDSPVIKVMGKWWDQVDGILKCAFKAVEQMKRKRPVLVQEHDMAKNETSNMTFSKGGVDRASQVCALIQIILDPYYRSMKGFSVLIQKQFVSFGYPFTTRCGLQPSKRRQSISSSPTKKPSTQPLNMFQSILRQTPNKQFSPTFIQFLQCISQLINCFPSCFQYSGHYLAQIAYELYSGKYNNFLFNNIHDKAGFKEIKNTRGIYQRLKERKKFFNVQFSAKMNVGGLNTMRDCPNVREYQVWKEYWDIAAKMNSAQGKEEDPNEVLQFRKLLMWKNAQ